MLALFLTVDIINCRIKGCNITLCKMYNFNIIKNIQRDKRRGRVVSKKHYVFVGNDSYGRIFICLEEEQAYREPIVEKNKTAAYAASFCGILLYNIRDRLVWNGMNERILANAAVIIGFFLGIFGYCLVERQIKKKYAGKEPLNTETLELELVFKKAKKQQAVTFFCFLILLGLSILFYYITIVEVNQLLFFILEILMIIFSVILGLYYQPFRRKKAIKLIKRWMS